MRLHPNLRTFVCPFILVLLTSLAASADDGETIRIFTLVNANAEAMTNMIEHLSDGNVKLALDARTNSIVMVGNEQQAKVIEALLLKLDEKESVARDNEEEEEEHEHDEAEWAEHGEREREWAEREEAEQREMRLHERERHHHAETLGHEIRRLEMKLQMTKAETEHQAKMMEFEVKAAELMAQMMGAKIKTIEKMEQNGEAHESQLMAAQLEHRVHELEAKRKSLQLEFIQAQGPMRVRELQFEIETRLRELRNLGSEEHEREHVEEEEARERMRDREEEAHDRERDLERRRDRESERVREERRDREPERGRGERRDRDVRRDRDQAINARRSNQADKENADSQLSETPMFSGPQVGERVTPFAAKLVFGDRAGETIRVFAEEEKAPQMLVFVHQITRPAIGLSRMLVSYAKKLEPKGLRSNVVFLSDDRTETEAWMKRARHALPQGVMPLVSVDGLEGPGAYGLNRKAAVTILVCNEGKVSANFALGQPSINVDAPKIGHALVRAIGGEEKPTLEEMGFAGRGMARRMNPASNPEHDSKYRSMMAPLIRKNATVGEVMEAAADIEAYAKKHVWFKQRVTKAAGLIVNGGKLKNYGTPAAQDYLKEWAAK